MSECPSCGGYMHRQSERCRECYLSSLNGKYVDRTCPVCSKEFRTHQSQIDRGHGSYCSRSCARSGSPTRPRKRRMVKCHVCAESFERHESEIKRSVMDENFCSPDCWHSYAQRENHPQWNGGQHERVNPEYFRWRRAVLERDAAVCRLCHSEDNLEVHHIKRFGSNPDDRWDVENGVTLCRDCHVRFRGVEEEYEDILSFVASVPVEVWA